MFFPNSAKCRRKEEPLTGVVRSRRGFKHLLVKKGKAGEPHA
ncbi:hypothetical protein CLOLEP_00921 [[Clostridium] leptum DSM 753]|uniref:Uncharacterized protein n=1 Tax=[Clostridium] leptum DSM 753 TaxID=428125 RepID=A7VQT9_9FIRM|nr:hypothetical protein CLOLEP_00921 [[Clostridium] leptum DSM 753]